MKPIIAILIPEPLKSKIISDTQIRRMESFANIRYKQYNKDDKQIPDIYKSCQRS